MFRIPPVSQWGRAVRKTSHSCHLMSQHALQWDALQQAEWTDGHHAPASALATVRLRFFLCRLHFLLMCSGLFWEGTIFYKATKDTMISDLLTYHPISHLQHMHTQPCKHACTHVCMQHMWVRKEGERKRPCCHTQLHGGMCWPQADGLGQHVLPWVMSVQVEGCRLRQGGAQYSHYFQSRRSGVVPSLRYDFTGVVTNVP